MGPKPSDKKIKFSDNERVLCFQGPIIYEAKCLKSEIREDDKAYYFIHYNGWNKHWDEWVNESRVLKYNESNVQKQRDLMKRFNKDKSKRNKVAKQLKSEKDITEKRKQSDGCSTPTTVATPQDNEQKIDPKKKPKLEPVVEDEIMLLSQPVLKEKVVIPADLRHMLVDDWDYITKQKQLFHLPAKVTVENILESYIEQKILSPDELISIREIISGLKEYFNVMLGSQLLYKFERPQYGDILEQYPNHNVSQIYGPYHLLRFFVKIGNVLSDHGNLSNKNMKLVTHYVHDCLNFLKQNKLFFQVNEYEIAPAEYHRRALT